MKLKIKNKTTKVTKPLLCNGYITGESTNTAESRLRKEVDYYRLNSMFCFYNCDAYNNKRRIAKS